MDFRAQLRSLRRRPGMHLIAPSYDSTVAYIEGMDDGASGALLTGFREFLLLKLGHQDSRAWSGLALRLALDDDRPRPTSVHEEAVALDRLFDLLDEFLAEIRGDDAIQRLFHEYVLWSSEQPGYNADLVRFRSSPPPAMLSVEEAAVALGITGRDVFDLIAADKLGAHRLGAKVLLRARDVEQMVAADRSRQ